jgi:hypothetical protein
VKELLPFYFEALGEWAGTIYLKFKNVLYRRATQFSGANRFFQIAICACVKSSECSTLGQVSISHAGCVRLMSGYVNKINCNLNCYTRASIFPL